MKILKLNSMGNFERVVVAEGDMFYIELPCGNILSINASMNDTKTLQVRDLCRTGEDMWLAPQARNAFDITYQKRK